MHVDPPTMPPMLSASEVARLHRVDATRRRGSVAAAARHSAAAEDSATRAAGSATYAQVCALVALVAAVVTLAALLGAALLG